MSIKMWEAVVAAHRLMGLLLEEQLTKPRDIRAKMNETDPFREMALDDRDQVIELAWYLSLSPFDGVFEVLGQAPGIPRRDCLLGAVADQRRALEQILRETANPDRYENHPYDLPSDLREMLLRYSTTKLGTGIHDQLRPGGADQGNSRLIVCEKKRLSANQLDDLVCVPGEFPDEPEPIEAVILSIAFDQAFFAENPDRRFLVRAAYFDQLHPGEEHVGSNYFVVVHRHPGGFVRRMFFNWTDGSPLPPDTDHVAEVLWNLPVGYDECRPFSKAYREAERQAEREAAQGAQTALEAAQAAAQWIQSGRQPQS